MGRRLRSQEPLTRAKLGVQRWPLTILCLLVSALSLTLGACSGPVFPSGLFRMPTPAPTLPRGCATGGDAPLIVPGYELPTTLPLVVDGIVYVGYALKDSPGDPLAGANHSRNYVDRFALAALHARDGTTLWRVSTTRGMWPYHVTGAWPLAVADGVLAAYDTGFDASGRAGLVGLRASDGATLWRTPLDYRTMTASGGVIYVTGNDGISAIRVVDGNVLWHTAVRGGPLSTPLLVGASLYVGNTSGSIVALRADTGAVQWSDVLDPISPPFGQYLPLGVIAGWLYVFAPSDEPQGIRAGVLRLDPTSGASHGYVLRLPPYTEALFPKLTAGVFYAVVSPFGIGTPLPSNAVAAYRLNASSSQLLWSTPIQRSLDSSSGIASYDAQTFYLMLMAEDHTWSIAAFRLSDGAHLWQQRIGVVGRAAITVSAGELIETAYGQVYPCHTPSVDQAPQIRAFASVDGSATWTRVLDARL